MAKLPGDPIFRGHPGIQLLDDAVKDIMIGLEKTPKEGEAAIIRIRHCASCEWRGESNGGHMTGETLRFHHVWRLFRLICDFLTWLQDEMVEADGVTEPMLISIPAPRALDLTFPFAVVEGKAYTTGKQISEAENQAVVSAACALKIQLDLNDLVKHHRMRSGISSPPVEIKPALFFSVCTQGPIHELWAHWTIVENKVRKFQSKLVESCNALLPEQGEAFILKPNNVGLWGTGSFKESVVERLGIVAKLATQS
ncbi:hypothetical protein ACMFMG_000304 [Clarireedia jacksonii]